MFFKAKYENGVDFQPKIYEGQLYYEYLGVSLTLGGDSAVSVRPPAPCTPRLEPGSGSATPFSPTHGRLSVRNVQGSPGQFLFILNSIG